MHVDERAPISVFFSVDWPDREFEPIGFLEVGLNKMPGVTFCWRKHKWLVHRVFCGEIYLVITVENHDNLRVFDRKELFGFSRLDLESSCRLEKCTVSEWVGFDWYEGFPVV